MVYLAIFAGFSWLYQDNHQFQRQTDNGISYLKASAQELSNHITGKKTPPEQSGQPQQSSTVKSNTDSISGRWTNRTASIYIDMQSDTLQQAMTEAVDAWNRTGAFKFKVVKSAKQADLVATSSDNSNDQAAGLAEMNQNTLTGYFIDGHIYLNKAYLLNPVYGYTHERIVNTAEHELGHAIGLSHTQEQSVMQPSGSFFTIQKGDINAVNRIYTKKPTISTANR